MFNVPSFYGFRANSGEPFEFTINTANISAGSSANNQFLLPTTFAGINISVYWGDGTFNRIIGPVETPHTYPSVGIYTIRITGNLIGWQFNELGDKLKMLNISKWGAFNITTGFGFAGCTNLTATATDAPLITGTSLINYFLGCSNFNGAIGNWNVSNVTNMSSMFESASAFNQNIGTWNTSSVTNMSSMFKLASAFNQNIGAWIVSNVSTFDEMFQNATAFNNGGSADINNWTIKTSGSVIMSDMFSGQNATTSCKFNQPIGSWNTSSVTTMESMFSFNTAFNQNLGSNWVTSSVTDCTNMFRGATAFNNGGSNSLINWNMVNVTSIGGMFNGCVLFNYDIGGWDLENCTNIASVLRGCVLFNQNVGNWKVSKVTGTSFSNGYSSAFFGCTAFNNGGSDSIKNWVINTTTDSNMQAMFQSCANFNQPIQSWNVSRVVGMQGMFSGATIFNQPIGVWDVSNVTTMSSMFNAATAFNQDIGAWNVSNVTTITAFMQGKLAANYSAANLDSIYNGWSSRSVQPNLNISFGSIKYTAAGQAGKNILTGAPNLWTITDGGI